MEEKQATLIIPEGEIAETEKPTETVETTINIGGTSVRLNLSFMG